MNIFVCIKQVPDTTEVKLDAETKTIMREGVASIINPFDTYAIEESIRIKEKLGGKVTAISMGILSAQKLLREAIALGADQGVLLSDKVFAGADTLATAYTLSMGIQKIGNFDLILCGKQSTDGDTAQVGPSLAEKLGIPHTTNVRKIEEICDGYIRCQRMKDDGYEIVEMPLPAVITVVKEINEPRLSTIKGIMRAKQATIHVWNANDIDADKSLCGLSGSPTQVVKTFMPVLHINAEMIKGDADQQAKKLVDKLLSVQPPIFR
ncbi:MAG: electron transfer flavoprotein subunit beta/FixA family protein [Oscillospiraceae bacterium]|nr:electron transfer flavoprotein subunit beta/FixA family protein [Oscillospiraceae bacterium]